MNKIAIIVLGIILLFPVIIASSNATVQETGTVEIVVVGHTNMGPMLPTVAAIKEVTSKYGGSVNVTWIDLLTQSGAEYAYEHGLTAHMNVVINGWCEYKVDGKTVTFQWFEGQLWTKSDLDTVISSILNKDNRATPVGNQVIPPDQTKTSDKQTTPKQVIPQGNTVGNNDNVSSIADFAFAAIVILVIVVAAWLIIRNFKK